MRRSFRLGPATQRPPTLPHRKLPRRLWVISWPRLAGAPTRWTVEQPATQTIDANRHIVTQAAEGLFCSCRAEDCCHQHAVLAVLGGRQ